MDQTARPISQRVLRSHTLLGAPAHAEIVADTERTTGGCITPVVLVIERDSRYEERRTLSVAEARERAKYLIEMADIAEAIATAAEDERDAQALLSGVAL